MRTKMMVITSLSLALTLPALGQSSSKLKAASNSNRIKKSTMKLEKTETQEEKKWSGSLGLILQGRRFDSQTTQRSLSIFTAYGSFNYAPIEAIKFNLSPAFSYSNGYIQTKDKTDAAKSTWSVSNASVQLIPSSYFSATLGALDQNGIHQNIIFDSIAFPAAKIDASTSTENDFVATAFAQSAIVTSVTLSTEQKDSEPIPTFQSAGVAAQLKNTPVEGNLKAYTYQFANLPSLVADDASKVGNSTTVIGSNPRRFTYEYKGYLASGMIKLTTLKLLSPGVSSQWIQNSQAPKGMNQGTITRFFIDSQVSASTKISPYYEFFRIEPDATVASLNDGRYNTNRVGFQTGLALDIKNLFKATLSGGDRDVIYTNTPQERERLWNLRLETLNVSI